jgi:hypothetical protein
MVHSMEAEAIVVEAQEEALVEEVLLEGLLFHVQGNILRFYLLNFSINL